MTTETPAGVVHAARPNLPAELRVGAHVVRLHAPNGPGRDACYWGPVEHEFAGYHRFSISFHQRLEGGWRGYVWDGEKAGNDPAYRLVETEAASPDEVATQLATKLAALRVLFARRRRRGARR